MFDETFDILNSNSTRGGNSKAPMKKANETYWREVFDKAEDYIRGLKCMEGQHLIDGRRSTGFIGFILNMNTFSRIFEEYVDGGYMSYMLTRKFSQDGLENTFGTIRASLGNNNNPTTTAFIAAYKRVISQVLNSGNFASCIFDCETRNSSCDLPEPGKYLNKFHQ